MTTNRVNAAELDAANPGSHAKTHFNVLVVGAGLGGLALAYVLGKSGHKVTVVEAAPTIGEVGAGINCMPNLARVLTRWGLDPVLRRHTMSLTRVDLRRWETGEFLGAATVMPEVEKRHGASQYSVHRADIHKALMDDVQNLSNTEIRANSMVVGVDFEKPSVTLQDGTVTTADIIVGADGLKSTCRKLLYQKLGLVDKARPTGDAAFRALIPLEQVQDPELREFVTTPVATRWMGPQRHIQGFPIRHGNQYNMVLCHPDTEGSVESWNAKSSKTELLSQYEGWDPERLQKLFKLIPDGAVMKWQLCDHDGLPTWVIGKMVLMGDACHPMLPYVGQGAAQAIEDAGVLGVAINQISSLSEAPLYLKTFELARKERVTTVTRMANSTRNVLHYPDGPEQQSRDEKFRAVSGGGENPDLLGDTKVQAFLWAFDSQKDYMLNLSDLLNQAKLEAEKDCMVPVNGCLGNPTLSGN